MNRKIVIYFLIVVVGTFAAIFFEGLIGFKHAETGGIIPLVIHNVVWMSYGAILLVLIRRKKSFFYLVGMVLVGGSISGITSVIDGFKYPDVNLVAKVSHNLAFAFWGLILLVLAGWANKRQ
jgi:hypothetical protein